MCHIAKVTQNWQLQGTILDVHSIRSKIIIALQQEEAVLYTFSKLAKS